MKQILLILLIALVALIAWLCVPFNILVIGVDAYANQPTEGSRSDGLIVIRVVPYLGQIKMVSIPRDTYAEIPCENYRQDKITHSHHFGGTQCTIDAVENLLDTKINYHVRFRFEDVMNITNLIDGVDVVANHTFNQDYFDQEVYHFDKGKVYNLRGRMALAYTRHRKSDTAFKRDERQRQVIQGIAKKVAAPSGWKYIPEVYNYSKQHMEIAVNPIRALSALPALILNHSEIQQHEITGEGRNINGIYYYVPDEASLEDARVEFQN